MSTGEKEPTFFSVKTFLLKEQISVMRRFYTARLFFTDLLFFLFYLYRNPFRTAKRKAPGNIYGETPLTVLEKAMRDARLQKGDTVLELGSGRGRGCFFIAQHFGAKVIGIEWVSPFVRIAKMIQKLLGIKNLTFHRGDFSKLPWEDADVIYMYGTCFSEELIGTLLEKMQKLPKGTRVVSVSYSLDEYSALFQKDQEILAPFPWGETSVYLQTKVL